MASGVTVHQELTDADRYTERWPGLLRLVFADPHTQPDGTPLPYSPNDVELWDAVTGRQVLTALDITFHWDPRSYMRVQTEVIADADGRPILAGDTTPALDDDGNVRTVTAHWLLADVRRREPQHPTEGTT
jgi:hypothetical protein